MSKAREVGVDEESIHEAVKIGLKVRKGARGRFDKELDVLLPKIQEMMALES